MFAGDEVEEYHEQQKPSGIDQDFPPPSFPFHRATSCRDLAVLRNLTVDLLLRCILG